jgi:broad specificity phosphatase PhoE
MCSFASSSSSPRRPAGGQGCLPIYLVVVILAIVERGAWRLSPQVSGYVSVEMARYVELRRHTDADRDVLTQEGVRAATEIGARLDGGYDLLVSTGAQRATQTLACFLAALGERVPGGVVVEAGLRSEREERWREAYGKAGSGALEAMRDADPEFVEADSAALGAALGRVLDALPDGGRALVVGHSPTNEAAILGLTGEIVGPTSKGAVAVCWSATVVSDPRSGRRATFRRFAGDVAAAAWRAAALSARDGGIPPAVAGRLVGTFKCPELM